MSMMKNNLFCAAVKSIQFIFKSLTMNRHNYFVFSLFSVNIGRKRLVHTLSMNQSNNNKKQKGKRKGQNRIKEKNIPKNAEFPIY